MSLCAGCSKPLGRRPIIGLAHRYLPDEKLAFCSEACVTSFERGYERAMRCGLTWRPSKVPTVGVRFLPGFKNKARRQ